MFNQEKIKLAVGILCLTLLFVTTSVIVLAQDITSDEKIIERYKQMLNQKPKEGSTFDRLYQLYLEGDGLEAMLKDYQKQVEAKPNNANLQLILGHIYKRLGKDKETLIAYQKAVSLAQNDYYTHFALGQFYLVQRQHDEAISELTQATTLSEKSQTISPEELSEIYKSLGNAYFSRDMLDEAIKTWEKIADLDPQNIFARIELADLFREQELYQQAIAQYQTIIEIKKDDAYRKCLSLREIGKIHEATANYDKARDAYDDALTLTTPGNWLRKDLQQRIIAIYSADANWKELISYYQNKLETNPSDPELHGLLAVAYIENQQLDEGINSYKKGLELAPTDTGLRLNLIDTYRNSEKYTEAAAEYEVLSEQYPDDFGIYRELGKLYVQLENVNKAKTVYQSMIDRDPTNASTFLTLAEVYTGHEWTDDAIAAYKKAITLAPNNLDYIEYFGEYYFRQGNREKAIETWNLMVANEKVTADNYDRLARLLETKAYSDESIEASRKAVELIPDAYRFREALAKRLMNNKKFDEALKQYTEAINLAPNAFFAEQMDSQRIELFRRQGTLVKKIEEVEFILEQPNLSATDKFTNLKRLAKMSLKLGNTTYGLEVLLKAKELQPNDITVNRWTAEIYIKQGRSDKAITIYEHLTDIDNTNAREYYSHIANSYLKGYDFEKATEAAKQVIAHSPRNPEGHQLLAQIAKQSDDYDSAVESYKQAIRLRPDGIEIRMELAAVHNLNGNTHQAIAQYWRCWELSDNVSDKLNYIKPLTEAYYDLGRHEELEEKLKQMVRTNTSVIAPTLALAQIYKAEGDLSSARSQLARALDRQRDNQELLYQLVEISIDLGDLQEALNFQQKLVQAAPDPIHKQRLGQLLFDAGREQEAMQAWSQVLHTKNQSYDAEMKLADLLILHGLTEEGLFALDNAAQKVKGTDIHIQLYKIGAKLVEINEPDRAIPHFKRILEMGPPTKDQSLSSASNKVKNTVSTTSNSPLVTQISVVPANINPFTLRNKLTLAVNLSQRIRPDYGYSQSQAWTPSSYDEAQAGALVQLNAIMQEKEKLEEFVSQFEENAAKNPKDTQTLELLAQLYHLNRKSEKIQEITDRLMAASPNKPVYQRMQLEELLTEKDFDLEKYFEKLDNMSWLTPEYRHLYITDTIRRFQSQGRTEDAKKLFNSIENELIVNDKNANLMVSMYIGFGKIDDAKKIIDQLHKTSTKPMSSSMFDMVARMYLNEGDIDQAVAMSKMYFDSSIPRKINPRRTTSLGPSNYSHGGYPQIQYNFPSPTTYYDSSRLQYLQRVFNRLWIINEHQKLYDAFQSDWDSAKGIDRLYPALAISYCYWWENKREESQKILADLQKEFPEDLNLKKIALFVSIQSGGHKTALTLLKALSEDDPRNRQQYHDLTLQIAVHIGDTKTVREMITKILSSPIGVRELYQFSQKLQQAGLTQSAIAVAQKTMNLAMRERDPNFLVQLSQHLEGLGRGVDAARIATRALRFSNQRNQSGQPMQSYYLQQASRLANRSVPVGNPAAKLEEAVKKNPNSIQAHLKLASFYENRNQPQKASTAYDAVLKLRPKDYNIRYRYAQMLQRNRLSKDAVSQYIILMKDHSNFNRIYSNYWDIMRTFFDANETEKLVSLVKELIDSDKNKNSRTIEFARRAAQQCRSQKKLVEAKEIYEKILDIDTYDNTTSLASVYADLGDREKAITLLQDKLNIEDYVYQVRILIHLSQYNEALDSIKTFVVKHEVKINDEQAEPSLLYLVTVGKIIIGDIQGSDTIYNKLIENITSKNRLQWLNTIADTYQKKGDVDREILTLTAATKKIDTNNTWQLSDTFRKLGNAYSKKGDKDNAKEYIQKMGTLSLMARQGAPPSYEKDRVARTYMEYEMWDEAEVLLTEVMNDLNSQQYYRENAQRQLMTIQQRRGGPSTNQNTNAASKRMNIPLQRSMAQQHMRQNQIPEAIQIYEQIAKVLPEDLESRSRLAGLYTRQNQHDKAITTWKALVEVDPENTKYQDGIINAYQSAGRINEAIKLAQEYIQTDTDTGVHFARLARLYASNSQVDKAIDTYKKAIELTPENASVHQSLAQQYIRKKNWEEAMKSFNTALQYARQGGEKQSIERQIMDVYRQQGKLDEYLKEAEKKGTLSFDMQRDIARNYYNQGKLDEAAKSYEKALKMTTQQYMQQDIERQLLNIYRRQGKLEEKLKEAEKNDTLTFAMQTELARFYSNKGESEKAISAYKQAIKMTTSSNQMDNIYREMMQLYVRSNDNEAAIQLYETMKQKTSSGPSVGYTSNKFTISFGEDKPRDTLINAYKTQEKLNFLKTHFSSKLEKNPIDNDSLALVAEIYRKTDDHVKAGETYLTLSKAEPKNIRAYYYAAAAFKNIGKDEQANEMLDQGNSVLSSSNKNHDFWFLCAIGTICYESRLYTSAIDIFKQAITAKNTHSHGSSNKTEEEILYDLIGKSAFAIKEYEVAAEAYQELKKISRHASKRKNAEQAIKRAYQEGKLYEKQLPKQIKKVEENPNSVDARLALAQNYEMSNKLSEAIVQYEKISELQPEQVQWYKKIAELYNQSNSINVKERLEKAAAAYEKAISLESTSYELYTSLATIFKRQNKQAEAEAVYRLALTASLKPSDHDSAVQAILNMYKGNENIEKRLTVLKELETKKINSPLLHKMLGDNYLEAGEEEKALETYKKWFEILSNQPDQRHHAEHYFVLTEELLNKFIMLDFALELAKRAAETRPSSVYISTLGHAYLANDEYDKALEQFQHSLGLQNHSGHSQGETEVGYMLTRVSQMHKHASDKEKYLEMMGKLLELIPENIGNQLENNLSIAKLCLDLGMTDKAKSLVLKTGFLPETSWATIGPFDNTKGVGYNTAYIPEEKPKIDQTAKYDGLTGKIGWIPSGDVVFDGFFDFGKEENWYTAYAAITISSPDERNAHIRFDSDDQGKVWLNGKKVYAHRRTRGAVIDRRTIPVTLTAGNNTILVKVCNESSPWGFYLRITDLEGNPFTDLKIVGN